MHEEALPLVLCLIGPTASGKTGLALKVVKYLPCEIVSVDSAMVYRGLDIGTAKPSQAILAQIPHHLVDICDLTQEYSAGDFYNDVRFAIDDIIARGKVPLLVGGTMLYFNVLQRGIASLPQKNAEVRNWLQQLADAHGWQFLYRQLHKIDAQVGQKIHPHDKIRIQRALEVYILTGKNLSSLYQEPQPKLRYKFYNIILAPTQRCVLHHCIAQRFYTMLDQGLCAEVKQLLAVNHDVVKQHLVKIINYRHMCAYLAGECSWQIMQEQAISATRQFAKRQITWLKNYTDAPLFASDQAQLTQIVCEHLSTLLTQEHYFVR